MIEGQENDTNSVEKRETALDIKATADDTISSIERKFKTLDLTLEEREVLDNTTKRLLNVQRIIDRIIH